jgi:hypothetical protein
MTTIQLKNKSLFETTINQNYLTVRKMFAVMNKKSSTYIMDVGGPFCNMIEHSKQVEYSQMTSVDYHNILLEKLGKFQQLFIRIWQEFKLVALQFFHQFLQELLQ